MRLIPVNTSEDIPAAIRHTPVSRLLEYHNLNRALNVTAKAELIVAMCMDNRKHLRIPENFAYVIRCAGANVQFVDFNLSFAIAVGNVTHIALIGHDRCGMSGLMERRDDFVKGMIANAGWEKEKARVYFDTYAPAFEIGDEVAFVLEDTNRIRQKYPKVKVVPLFYRLEDRRLYIIAEP